jgi:hypothetical protein
MATTIIPIEDAENLGQFLFTVDLDGTNFQFDMRYNQREDFWYLNISDIDGNLLRSGIKVVSNWPLIRLLRSTPRPNGEIITIDTRYAPLDPGLADLGVDVLFGYEELDTIP